MEEHNIKSVFKYNFANGYLHPFQNYATFYEKSLHSNVDFMSYLLLKIANVNNRGFEHYFI